MVCCVQTGALKVAQNEIDTLKQSVRLYQEQFNTSESARVAVEERLLKADKALHDVETKNAELVLHANSQQGEVCFLSDEGFVEANVPIEPVATTPNCRVDSH